MNILSVSFFGHRQIDNPLQIESQLEEIISSLLKREEYIEFLVGRDGEFDQLVSSTIRRCKRRIRDDNSALIWVMPYPTAEFRVMKIHFVTIMTRLRFANRRQRHTTNLLFKSETG